MIDQLLGRASLKDRIEELEEEAERLRRRYEAESDRKADAVTAKQEAEERQNRLEDRIAQLEGELERVDEDESDDEFEFRRREQLRGARLEEVFDRVASVRTGPEGACTVFFDPQREDTDRSDAERYQLVEDAVGERASLLTNGDPCLVCFDDAGLVSVRLEPPVLPESNLEPTWSDRFELEREWFLPTGSYALALVRADLFALGIYEDGDRVDYRGFESEVKGSHSKGGFSQARFERIRDDQIDDHLERCHRALAEFDTDRLYLAGQRGVVETLAGEGDFEPDATAAVDATGDPKSALEDAHRSFWTTELGVF
ncbi:Vms1/Ankzf1 family peptidyl-tRNA hydrolase [Halostagnicola sp. A-GB9-2]|uniref:Vms1/Ankzf1 family peptidyl-tRNA hydrolase n=1 Tax=Halostagnicola sp. A-GB9-2 TaxID=3048066 RepID=UPI0024C0BF49|nr:Vms1/Ankzf1 family peptidyl-tRNA hydrolase [Halostagnicola sp. A-GB9-2]MDJ1431207.1 Vms1/Ankzf1 family peptidyl-tRNA hydrolase [Halostagnicola sp. A-GB9-2]